MVIKRLIGIVLFFGLVCLAVNDHIPRPRFTEEDVEWLTRNIYFEARNQSITGQLAVLMVTLNRQKHSFYPYSIKQIVTQGGKKLNKCQFSWYCDGKPDIITDFKTFQQIRTLVLQVLPVSHKIYDVTGGALFYHATYVRPKWAKHKKNTAKIETHIFYK